MESFNWIHSSVVWLWPLWKHKYFVLSVRDDSRMGKGFLTLLFRNSVLAHSFINHLPWHIQESVLIVLIMHSTIGFIFLSVVVFLGWAVGVGVSNNQFIISGVQLILQVIEILSLVQHLHHSMSLSPLWLLPKGTITQHVILKYLTFKAFLGPLYFHFHLLKEADIRL